MFEPNLTKHWESVKGRNVYKVPVFEDIKEVYVDVTLEELVELLNTKLALKQNEDGSHTLVTLKGETVRLKSATEHVDFNQLLTEYLMTGTISRPDIENTHNLPLPVYNIAQKNGIYGSTVLLKNGKRAIIVDGQIIEGVSIT